MSRIDFAAGFWFGVCFMTAAVYLTGSSWGFLYFAYAAGASLYFAYCLVQEWREHRRPKYWKLND
jgi:hypothetical protein